MKKFRSTKVLTIDHAKALELAKAWHDLHDEAECEEGADCHRAAERLRMQAADVEHDLREGGYDVSKILDEYARSRRRR